MTRRIFISYQHLDQMKAKGLNLMRYNPRVNVDFTGRHLLDPVKSSNQDYITAKIKEQIRHSSATIVLIGADTATSAWVQKEIEWSLEKGNGVIGIRIDSSGKVPQSLLDCGAEVLDWLKPEDVNAFDGAIERAIAATRRTAVMPRNNSGTCTR